MAPSGVSLVKPAEVEMQEMEHHVVVGMFLPHLHTAPCHQLSFPPLSTIEVVAPIYIFPVGVLCRQHVEKCEMGRSTSQVSQETIDQ